MSAKRPAPGVRVNPQLFGRYLLLDRVARGGMAEVWRAKIFGAEDFQRIVAIKKILAHVAEDDEFISMFKDEAKITVLLQHANIGQVYELGKFEDTYFIAMEYVPGKDCKTIWKYQSKRHEPFPIPLACYVMQRVAEGLDYAHRKKDNLGSDLKIVHRDVSPQNILVSWEGEVKIIDFGIAKAAGKDSHTQAGILKGKFGYMSPEQIRGHVVDQRADVFSMGVCFYELLTGERAFKADSDFSLLEMVRNVELVPPAMVNKQISPRLERILFKALAKEPEDRYQWASDFSEEIQRYLLDAGKLPTRIELGKYLREHFTVDYDRERLRMEAFREIQLPAEEPTAALDVREAPTAVIDPLPSGLDRASLAVQAAMQDDGGLPDGPWGRTSSVSSRSSSASDLLRAMEGSGPRGATAGGNGAPRPGSAAEVTVADLAGEISSPTLSRSAYPLEPAAPVRLWRSGLTVVVALALIVATVLGVFRVVVGTGTLIVSSHVPDVVIFIDGVQMGTTRGGTLTVSSLRSGPHDLAAQKPGYYSFTGSVEVVKNRTTQQVIPLTKIEAYGHVDILSKPTGAQIILDGRDTGLATPTLLKNISATSPHKLLLRHPGYRDLESELRVEADVTVRKELRLRAAEVKVHLTSAPTGARVFRAGERKELGRTPLTLDNIDPDAAPQQLILKRRGCQSYETSLAVADDALEVTREIRLRCP